MAEPKIINANFGEHATKFAQITNDVLFGDVWERDELGKRERSLITVAALIAMNRSEQQLVFHLERALENGVTKDELYEAVTHLAFYSGWPCAVSALQILNHLTQEADPVT